MYDTYLFIGHGTYGTTFDPGATYKDLKEYDLNKMIVEECKKLLSKYELNVLYGEQNFKNNLLKNEKIKNKKGLSVHINATVGGTGTEILVPAKEYKLTNEIELSKNISNLLNIPDRGLKSKNYDTGSIFNRKDNEHLNFTDWYGEIRNAYSLGYNLNILEVGFIENEGYLIKENYKKIADLIVKYFLKITDYKENTTSSNDTYYRVVVGSFSDKKNAEKRVDELINKGYKDTFIDDYKKGE